MSVKVDFYTFEKRPNSTKRPGVVGVTYNCHLIEPSSVLSPSITLNVGKPNSPAIYNYARIEDFNRYYYISDWTYADGLWIAHLTVDVMASYRGNIGASSQYVLRSSAQYDGAIIDTMYPAKAETEVVNVVYNMADDGVVSDFTSGSYVVGVINGDSQSVGAVSYYAFNNSQFRTFSAALMGELDWTEFSAEDISEALYKSVFNPFQYVVSCVWFPYTVSGTAVSELEYGWWKLATPCKRLSSSTTRLLNSYHTIPKHPLSGSRGSYLNSAPFSRYTFYWPPVGTFPLDPALMRDGETLGMQCFVDNINGSARVIIFNKESGATIVESSAQIGVPIQLAQIAPNFSGAIGSVISTGASLFSGNFLGAGAGIANAVDNLLPKVQTQGHNGSAAAWRWNPNLQAEFFTPIAENKTQLGRPLCKTVKIADISGYVQTANAELEIDGYNGELHDICATMNAGFFYE